MRKIKFRTFTTRKDTENIVLNFYPEYKCPECSKNGVYAACIEDQYDEKHDDYVILSFDLFCKECGALLGKWDNTNREYFLDRKQ